MNEFVDDIVLFWGPWCSPCNEIISKLKRMNPILLNMDENYDLVVRYKIVAVPTLLIFSKGEVVDSFVGSLEIEGWICRFTTP
jgi:thioredoxin 1